MHTHKRAPDPDRLIAMEWRIMRDMKKMLRDTNLSVAERTRLASALGYHATVLNKLLNQKGEAAHFNEATLGDFISDIDKSARTLVRRDFEVWTRKLSLKK
ncbi:MAG: hypothetical protein ABSC20_03990 [Candidatus Bathyarchaeia archaeon]